MKKLICRLCLNELEACSKEYEVLESTLMELLNVVLVNLNFNATKDPVVCNDCKEKLHESYQFKMRCLATDDCLSRYKHSSGEDGKADLKLVYLAEKITDQNYEFKVNDEVCRICLNLTNIPALKFDIFKYNQFLGNSNPELDLPAITGDNVCESCQASLENYAHFVECCMETERKIENYQNTSAFNYGAEIDLQEVLEYSFENYDTLIKIETIGDVKVFVKNGNFEMEDAKDDNITIGQVMSGDERTAVINESIENKILIKDENYYDSLVDSDINSTENSIKTEIVDIKPDCRDESIKPVLIEELEQDKIEYNAKSQLETLRGTKFPRLSKDRSQLPKVKKQAKMFTCEIGPFRSKYKVNADHSLVHQTKSLKCKTCKFRSNNKFNLRKHEMKHTSSLMHEQPVDMKMFKCTLCSFETKYKGSLQRHVPIHDSCANVTVFKCEFCSYESNCKRGLRRHILIHKPLSEVNVFKCELCPFETRHKRCLLRHVLIHKPLSNVEVFKCEFCNYATKHKRNLLQHILIHKSFSGTELFKCEICFFATKHKASLARHILVHKPLSKVKVFKCELCPYEANQKVYLQQHSLIHKSFSNVKVFKCEFCPYKTKRNKDLQRHILIHKSPSNVEVYKCEFCSFETKHKKNLPRHVISHKPLSEANIFKC